MEKNKGLKTFLVDTGYFIIGSILYAISIQIFAVNANFAPGGISGIAVIINHFTAFPIGTITLILNIPLLIISWKLLGKKFLFKSIWAMLISAFFLDFIFPFIPAYTGNPLLASLFTGVFMGAGLAVIYVRGSSTGGSDFIILSIRKIKPNLSVGQISFIFDIAVILLGGFVYKNIDSILYGIISSYVATLVMDKILYGAGNGKMAIIVTNKAQEIASVISEEIDRGSTIVKAKGSYTGEEREMLYCFCRSSQIHKVTKAARIIDSQSLVIISEANEIIGKGFIPPNIPGTSYFIDN